jgi:hypothetical protein
VLEAGCFAHARRKFFEPADVASSARKKSRGQRSSMIYPIALEAVQRLDALFDVERDINGKSPAEPLAVRREPIAPRMTELHTWLTEQVAWLSRGHDLAKACRYMPGRWDAFTWFLDDGRICLSNNAAERAALHPARPQGMAAVRLESRRPARGHHLHADPDRQAQRCRSARLARRFPRSHR